MLNIDGHIHEPGEIKPSTAAARSLSLVRSLAISLSLSLSLSLSPSLSLSLSLSSLLCLRPGCFECSFDICLSIDKNESESYELEW